MAALKRDVYFCLELAPTRPARQFHLREAGTSSFQPGQVNDKRLATGRDEFSALRCLNRDIQSGPRRELGRLPACYFVCERNFVTRIGA
jgi:hypothetical protein